MGMNIKNFSVRFTRLLEASDIRIHIFSHEARNLLGWQKIFEFCTKLLSRLSKNFDKIYSFLSCYIRYVHGNGAFCYYWKAMRCIATDRLNGKDGISQ